MKQKAKILVIFSFLLCMVLPVHGFAASKIDFKSYNEGIALIKSLNKKGFIYFHADWCKYCKDMKKKVFTNEKIIKYLNENYISIKVDTEVETKIASKYNVRGLPLLYFLNNDGSALVSNPGYVPAKELLPMLKYINTESYSKGIKFADFLKQDLEQKPTVSAAIKGEVVKKINAPYVIYFGTNMHEPNDSSIRALEAFIDGIKNTPIKTINIDGYTDSAGSDVYNEGLSLKRAKKIEKILYRLLSNKKIKFLIRGYGEKSPAVNNNSIENMAKNRRVIITFN